MSRPAKEPDRAAAAGLDSRAGETTDQPTAWITMPVAVIGRGQAPLEEATVSVGSAQPTELAEVPITAEIPHTRHPRTIGAMPDGADAFPPAPTTTPSSLPRAVRSTVIVVATLATLLLAAFAVEQLSPGLFSELRNQLSRADVSLPAKHSIESMTSLPGSTSGGPLIDSIAPKTGSAGSSITISGANLFSSSGLIVATFNGKTAPTHCPTEHECLTTVPAAPHGASSVTVRVDAGILRSNSETFEYR